MIPGYDCIGRSSRLDWLRLDYIALCTQLTCPTIAIEEGIVDLTLPLEDSS